MISSNSSTLSLAHVHRYFYPKQRDTLRNARWIMLYSYALKSIEKTAFLFSKNSTN